MSRMITTILDTTPRQWGHYFRSLAHRAGSRFVEEIVVQPALSVSRVRLNSIGSICILASVAIHVALAASLVVKNAHEAELLAKGEVMEVTLVSTPPPAADEPETIYDDSSSIIVKAPKKKKTKSAADRLLNRFRHLNIAQSDQTSRPDPAASPKARPGTVAGLKSLAGATNGIPAMVSAPQLDLKSGEGFSRDEMNQHLARYQKSFQSCYEKALLIDSSLNGKVQFAMRAGPQGNIADSQVTFDGVGQANTRHELQTCLRRIVREIRFPQTLAAAFGRTIQFQAVLSM